MQVRRLWLCHMVSQAGGSPSWRRKGKKEHTIRTVHSPPPLLLFCLLCVTNLGCPAGTNYSILMSAVSNNCIWWVCYFLIHLLMATTLPQITFPSNEATYLMLTSWLGISLQRHQGWGTTGQPWDTRVCRMQRTVGRASKGISLSGWRLQTDMVHLFETVFED